MQERVLEAAAVAIRMVETGAIVAPGAAAAFLLAEPPVPVIEGRLRPVSPWRRVSEAATEAIEAARRDPRAAQDLLRAILLGRTDLSK